MRCVSLIFIVGVVSFVMSGCGSDSEAVKLAPVSGVVRHNGKPLSGAYVKFIQEGCPIVAGGLTDENGNFQVTAFKPGDGAPVGENQISISLASQLTEHRKKMQEEVDAALAIEDPEEQGKKLMELEHKSKNPFVKGKSEKPAKPTFPMKYADPSTSNLKFTVKEGEENLCQFDLEG